MELGIARAQAHGSCIVALANAHHLCRIGAWAEMAVAAGLVSVHFVNVISRPIVAPWGGRDARIGDDQTRAVVEAFRVAKKTFTNVEFSQADHGFFCDQRSQYEPNAAREAWALTLAFLSDYTGA